MLRDELIGQDEHQDQLPAIKCLVWDLDNTLWHGTLLENDDLVLRDGVAEIIRALDERGILQSIASKNEQGEALRQLEAFGLADYFLYPQITWNSKASSIRKIAEALNIGLNTFAFMDDQPFERDEVRYSLPQVRCFDAADLADLLRMPAFKPRFVTADSRNRRQMMRADQVRKVVEEEFHGPQEAFLASLDMALAIFPAQAEDLQRAEELTIRTNQLNATGYTYSFEELDYFRQSADHLLLMARLEDKYGPYGHIGLALVERSPALWTIKLLLMSCRVMSRGVGGVLLGTIMRLARNAGAALHAEFVPTDRNRMMNITYRFAGFYELHNQDKLIIFAHDLAEIAPFPPGMTVKIDDTIR